MMPNSTNKLQIQLAVKMYELWGDEAAGKIRKAQEDALLAQYSVETSEPKRRLQNK